MKSANLTTTSFACFLTVCVACGSAAPLKEMSVDLGGGVKMEFVLIQPGSFSMGEGNEKHQVTLTKPFSMGKYEVTQEQWQTVMGSNPSHYKAAKNPAENVSWDDCQQFLARLNEKLRGFKAFLPTEAQWEYACRAGSTTKYCYGDDESRLGEYAWFGNVGGSTHPVGQKKPNAWGLYDMHGNVWEWCSDRYAEFSTRAQENLQGPASGSAHVLRGGAFSDPSADLASGSRGDSWLGGSLSNVGLRVVLMAGEATNSCFGIPCDFSGKLTPEQESGVPPAFRNVFEIEDVRDISGIGIQEVLKGNEKIAEESHNGVKYVAVKVSRCAGFANGVSGMMIVIERYRVMDK